MEQLAQQLDALKKQISPEKAKKLAGAALAALTLYLVRRYTKFLQWRRNIIKTYPGSTAPSLVLGDLQELMATGGFGEEFFLQIHEKYGEFTRFFLGPTILNLSISNPEHVMELYKNAKSRPMETYLFLSYLGKENLLFTHGKMVKKMRLIYGKMISNTDQLQKVNEVSFREFGILQRSWSNAQGGVDVFKEIGPVIYDVMGQVLFGGTWTDSDIGRRIMELHLYLIHNVNKWMFWPFPPYFLPKYQEYLSTLREWRNLCYSMIQDRAELIKSNPKKYANDQSALTLLVTAKDENGKPFFSKERAISTMCGFLNGAYDTTHSTLYWIMFNLARYPDVQQKVRDDIQSIIGTRTTCSIEEQRSMDYLDVFLKESMRHNVTVPVNQRVNYEEDLTIGGYKVPKGTNVNIPMRVVFSHKETFGPDVDVFRPERFLPEDPYSEKGRKLLSAFGGHSRMCIGETFAKVELKAFVIHLLQNYHVSFVNADQVSEVAYTEAGVNQPAEKALFNFTRLDDPEARIRDNLNWWTPEKTQRKTIVKA